jgi:tRNA threonylcarbamoyladenosine biosynthesis protein TsaE
MGESNLTKSFRTEAELVEVTGVMSRSLLAGGCYPLVFGLRGTLGSGKTTWARALLRGLGYTGRVPSPTYTLLEEYPVGELLVVHLDLYRLGGADEIENLGLRDWLAAPATWTLVEWPERAPQLERRCDLLLDFAEAGATARSITFRARTEAGIAALQLCCQANFNNNG